jgi:NACalpha-BTF3-like transcription factor
MTRVDLSRHVELLDTAARAQGLRARAEVASAATDQDIANCESALAISLPDVYKATLREWNGASIEIYDPESKETGDEVQHAEFVISDTKWIAATTRVLRELIAEAMAGSAVAADVAEAMSRIAVISSRNDINVFLTCDLGTPLDHTVRYVDLAYALGEFPPTTHVIATSPDEYLEKCFAHLAKTLERETYWW